VAEFGSLGIVERFTSQNVHLIMKSHTMKTYIALILGAALYTGCSKSSSPLSQVTTPTNATVTTTITTNTLDGLQVENDKQILELQTKMELLRKTYNTNHPLYLDEQAKLNQKLALQKQLAVEIQAMKHQ